MPYKDTRVPIELIALYEYFGEFACRLFDECFNLIEISLLFLVNLYISISRFRSVGLDAQRNKLVVFGGEIQSLQDSFLKLVRLQNQMIRGGNYNRCIGIDSLDNV